MTISNRANEILMIINEKNIPKIKKVDIISSLQSPTDNQLLNPEFKSLWIMYHNISTQEKIHILKSIYDDYNLNKETSLLIKKIDDFSKSSFVFKNEIKKNFDNINIKIEDVQDFLKFNLSFRKKEEKLNLINIAIIKNNEKFFSYLINSLPEKFKSNDVINSSFYYSILTNNEKMQDIIFEKYSSTLSSNLDYNFTEAYIFSLQNGINKKYDNEKFGIQILSKSFFTKEIINNILKREESIENAFENLIKIAKNQDADFLQCLEKNFVNEILKKTDGFSEKNNINLLNNIKNFYTLIGKELPESLKNKKESFVCNKNTLKQKVLLLNNKENIGFIPKFN